MVQNLVGIDAVVLIICMLFLCTIFDKLRRKMLKKYKFIGIFGIVILWLFPSCFVCVVMRLRLDKKVFIIPFYVLRTYFYVVMPICCVMSHSTLQ